MMRLRREDPRVVGPYRLHRRLGTGGMGVVYLGSDRRGQKVALKLIRSELAEDQEFRTRFAREVAAAARIRSGCIARLVASDIDAERPWLATSYVPGPSLYKRVGDEGPLPWPEVAAIGAALADGLVHVHQAGVVHRDLKPSNILLSPKGPRIIDFGIAWSTGASTLTHVGTAVGSPGFLAPEQVRGISVTGATDVFALGTTLAYAATGDSPFGQGSSEVMLYRVVHEEPELGDVPGTLAPVIRACLAKEPVDRPTTTQLRDRLRELTARGAAIGRSQLPHPAATAEGDPHPSPSARQSAGGSAGVPQPQSRQSQGAQSLQRPVSRPSTRRPPMPPTVREPLPPGLPSSAPAAGPGQSSAAAHQAGHARTAGPAAGAARGTAQGAPHPPKRAQPHAPASASDEAATVPHMARPAVREAPTAVAGRRTPPPGRPVPSPSRRLLRQRIVVFITVTIAVAVAIAVAQGCESRTTKGLGPAVPTSRSSVPAVVAAQGAAPSAGVQNAAQLTAVTAVQSTAAGQPLPTTPAAAAAADWANRRYPDPSDGSMILLRNGHSTDGGSPVSLTAVLPARYRGAPAAVVILTRLGGSAPEDLVELFGLGGAEPVLLASHASTGTPQGVGSWQIVDGSILRQEHTPASGASPVSTTRYTPDADGTMTETWPGSGTLAQQQG
ncbi:protein kinase domain-containing protein [Streptacidiphilus albus]|uniref:protein kinase domain-containing protein n=1 Tax=Streptacidiphilus albus TaxID=105425 RepID=UPI000A6E80CA|nr:serine/threonine-protein kinase [Streptacidiphilus albus]